MCAKQRGVGGKGWEGDASWKANVKTVAKGGDIRGLKGGIPTQAQGEKLIKEAGGKLRYAHPVHSKGGVSTHNYHHIHYKLGNNYKNTLEILSDGFIEKDYLKLF